MSTKSLFQHRHYVAIAEIIASIGNDHGTRDRIAALFALRLQGTNANFDQKRFLTAAMGYPSNNRDKTR